MGTPGTHQGGSRWVDWPVCVLGSGEGMRELSVDDLCSISVLKCVKGLWGLDEAVSSALCIV